jgi:hypothetical protein
MVNPTYSKKEIDAYVSDALAYFLSERERIIRVKSDKTTGKVNLGNEMIAFCGLIITVFLLMSTILSITVQENALRWNFISKASDQVLASNYSYPNGTKISLTDLEDLPNLSGSYVASASSMAALNSVIPTLGEFLFVVLLILVGMDVKYRYDIGPLNQELDRVELIIKYLHAIRVKSEVIASIASKEEDIRNLIAMPLGNDEQFLVALRKVLNL